MSVNDLYGKEHIDEMDLDELLFEINYADGMRMKAEDAVRRAEADLDFYTERACAMRRRLAEMRKK